MEYVRARFRSEWGMVGNSGEWVGTPRVNRGDAEDAERWELGSFGNLAHLAQGGRWWVRFAPARAWHCLARFGSEHRGTETPRHGGNELGLFCAGGDGAATECGASSWEWDILGQFGTFSGSWG